MLGRDRLSPRDGDPTLRLLLAIWLRFAGRTLAATLLMVLLVAIGVGIMRLAERADQALVPQARALLRFLANGGALVLLAVVLIEAGRALRALSRMAMQANARWTARRGKKP